MMKRDSKYELLRIFAMLMIIFHHYVIHGVMHYSLNPYVAWKKGSVINKVFSVIPSFGGKVGVAIFFMITGFFLYKTNRISVRKLYGTALFYGFITVIICLVYNIIDGHIGLNFDLIKRLMNSVVYPLSSNVWPFVTAYFFLIIMNERLNKIIATLNRKQLLLILSALILFWTGFSELVTPYYDYMLRAIVFYVMGAYIGKFITSVNKVICVIGATCGIAFFAMLEYIGAFLYIDGNIKAEIILKICTMIQSIITPFIALCIFELFSTIKIEYKSFINHLASMTLGIYLLHDSVLTRNILWSLLCVDKQFESVFFPLYSLVTVITIFLVCCIIDLLRIRFFEPIYNRVLNKIQFEFMHVR